MTFIFSREESSKIHLECEKRGRIMRMMSLLQFILICIYVILPLFDLFFDSSLPSAEEAANLVKGAFLYDTVQPFPYPMLFPYNANYGISYFLTYVYTSFSGFVVVSTLFSEDSLFCFFLTYACGRFELLHREIQELKHNKDLSRIVVLHTKIIEFCYKLEKFFSPILLVNFLISSFLICLVGFQLATVGRLGLISGTIIKKKLVLSGKIIAVEFRQVFCVHRVDIGATPGPLLARGQTHRVGELGRDDGTVGLSHKTWYLFLQSLKTRIEIYNCDWEDGYYSLSLRKGLVFILARSQKPLRITALKFSVLSLESFTKILSTSASYFALLRTMIEEN